MEAYMMTTLHDAKCLRKILEAVSVMIALNSNSITSFMSVLMRVFNNAYTRRDALSKTAL